MTTNKDKLIKITIISILLLVVIIFFSSCSRYTFEGKTKGNCGAWQPKHFKS